MFWVPVLGIPRKGKISLSSGGSYRQWRSYCASARRLAGYNRKKNALVGSTWYSFSRHGNRSYVASTSSTEYQHGLRSSYSRSKRGGGEYFHDPSLEL